MDDPSSHGMSTRDGADGAMWQPVRLRSRSTSRSDVGVTTTARPTGKGVAPGPIRLSNYTITAELDDGQTLLVHGYSGAWDIVATPLAVTLRRRFGRSTPFTPLIGRPFDDDVVDGEDREPSLPDGTVDHLLRRGFLTTMSVEEEQQLVASLASQLHGLATREPPSYVFTVSYECNLSCAYCFQDSLRSQAANQSRLVPMSRAMVDRIFGVMPEIDARHGWSVDGPRPERRVTLFGGEPLLARFRPIVEHIVRRTYADGPASVSAVSNATELQAYRDLIGPGLISFIQVTVDGAPEDHDRRRFGPGGVPTFATIADNVELALARDAQVKLRINVDGTNSETLPILADLIEERGWFAAPNFSAYATPVHESAGTEHEACGNGSWRLGQKLEQLAADHPTIRLIHGPDAPWQRRVRELLNGTRDPLLSLQPSYCGAHTQTWVFDAHGDIYACWERAGYPKDRIGRLSPDGTLLMDADVEEMWRNRTVASNPVCARCRYAFYCGGGCALLAELQNGELHSNFCDDFSRRFKALAAAEVRAHRFAPYLRAARAWQPTD